jgi:hypothetical protein
MSTGKTPNLLDEGLNVLDSTDVYQPTEEDIDHQFKIFLRDIDNPEIEFSSHSAQVQIDRWTQQNTFDKKNKFPMKIAIWEAALERYNTQRSSRWKQQARI